jgi:phytoene dehydrogenase-like protein
MRTLLALAERDVPGLTALATHVELATPLSVEHFAEHPDGAIYGLPAVPERFAALRASPGTEVGGLLLAGADVYMHGVAGAMMGGVAAAAAALGERGFERVFAAAAAAS